MTPLFRFGIDLGGTKIELAALDAAGELRLRRRVATPVGNYEATLAAVATLVQDAERELAARASVGVATPGSPAPLGGRMRNANSTCLNGRALKDDLEHLLARPVRIANDANCFALSEAVDGAGRDAEVVFGVILGTGVGGGLVVRRRAIEGANAIAGEWGHNPLPGPEDPPLPACYCGRRGCVETYLSGPGLAADHARATGERLTAEEIAARAGRGDAASEATLSRYAERLARALASVINVVDPDAIILGGGLSHLAHLYERVPALWVRHVFSDAVRTRLAPPRHGDSSGVRGAAWLWEPGEAPVAIDATETVTLRPIDEANIDFVGELRVIGEQRYHVASVAKSFWQVVGREGYWMRAIYAGAEPVGFVLLHERPGEIYLNRLLVDFRHQGRGYGRAAIRLVLEHARAQPGCNQVRLSHVRSNEAVARLYAGFGFRHTGVVDADGEVEMVLELPA